MSKQDDKAPFHFEHSTHDVTTLGGRIAYFFEDYWPIMVWVGFFVLMLALPLTLSGMFVNPFVTAGTVWSGYGLMIVLVYLLALGLTLLKPGLLGPYMLVLAIYALIAAEQGKAWQEGSSIAILFLTYVFVGVVVYLLSGWEEKKRTL